MALNPLSYTEKIVRSFLRYQLTAFAFADERLQRQMRTLLSLDDVRHTPLLMGPYVSLSKAFQPGAAVGKLVADGVLHPHMKNLVPFPAVYRHQEEAIRAVTAGSTTLVSTGTGSGKSECFLYPIVSRCLQLMDLKAPPGICAVIVYPMNALAEDQLGRLRELLAGTSVTFGMYVGKTPEREAAVTGTRLAAGSSRETYRHAHRQAAEQGRGVAVHPPEEVCSREAMRTPGRQPRILLTNVEQLELLLTRQKDVELFDGASLDFLVFDEAHTFTGAKGAEAACLVRRLRSFCGKGADQTVCVATSATIVDDRNPDAARDFAARFFGVDKTTVQCVKEVYEEQQWADKRAVPAAVVGAAEKLREVLASVDAGDPGSAVAEAWRKVTGSALGSTDWERALHDALSSSELLFKVAQELATPRVLSELLERLKADIGRDVTEEELLVWLTLGAAARRDGRPLVRPVTHCFLRGLPGARATFDAANEPVLHLFSDDETPPEGAEQELGLRVSTCTTCGQHYFEHSLGDFEFTERRPGGGVAKGDSVVWEPVVEAQGGTRVLLIDKLISEAEEEEGHKRLAQVFLCKICGAAHPTAGSRCLACGSQTDLMPIWAVKQSDERRGKLTSCLSCGAIGHMVGGRFMEPVKRLRGVNVADVHVVAQDMIHHAERERLLVFCDNRQDAAFQAGWMQDHARRFRLRALMFEGYRGQRWGVGDLVSHLDKSIGADETLSRALLPEVWATAPKEEGHHQHNDDRKFFLRVLVLRELVTAIKQRIGLEPWGRLKVEYPGLNPAGAFFEKWAAKLATSPGVLAEGVAALLDLMRRKVYLYDPADEVFSRIWAEGDRPIQSGYLPLLKGVPKGLKFTRSVTDDSRWVDGLYSPGHATVFSQVAGKWGVEKEETEDFLKELWALLVDPTAGLLRQVTLTGSQGHQLPNTAGSYQVDANHLRITEHSGIYRCRNCRRRTVRTTPGDKCLAWHCKGTLEQVAEDPDNYDLALVDQRYKMVKPREHTAMVPHATRERIEGIFKGDTDEINALVCTQTLELGVDIGALDAVLLRNVPPLPANYWQRVGRAGRRHRMAVNVTYCRPVSHDRAYFKEPLKMLGGRIDPPSFNLSNELMVAKHVHSTVLTRLHQLARPSGGLPDVAREQIQQVLSLVFPQFVKGYLFDGEGDILPKPLDVTPLGDLVRLHKALLLSATTEVFQQGWPASDAAVTSHSQLERHVDEMHLRLAEVVKRLHRRLIWARDSLGRLDAIRHRRGVLDPEQEAFHASCKKLIKRLKGAAGRERAQAEGVDDYVTHSVLGREGFLPGYGLETGSVVGMAEVPRWVRQLKDFSLPRPPSVALREYVPGNLIYANSQKFVPRRYVRDAEEGVTDVVVFEVDLAKQVVREAAGGGGGGLGAATVRSAPISDVQLLHFSRISDEEDNRFQLGVTILGRELDQHSGGKAFTWGERQVHHRKGVRLQLINVGATQRLQGSSGFGYPVCLVCGQSVSVYSSTVQIQDFSTKHTERCGQAPEPTAFHCDFTADVLTLAQCADEREAFSLAEALRFAAAEVLDMEIEDLQVLVVGRQDGAGLDAHIYDTMPGGSGLLDQLCARFTEVADTALRLAKECPSQCGASCVDCFQMYRNAFYHKHLDRNLMIDRFETWGNAINFANDIPPKQPATASPTGGLPVNAAEKKLRGMILAAGLPDGRWQAQCALPVPLCSTTPDVSYDDPDDVNRKIFIYLDGLSNHIHGNPETRARDNDIRNELRSQGHEVIVITAHDLGDKEAMTGYLRRLARQLVGREATAKVSSEADAWFRAGAEAGEAEAAGAEARGAASASPSGADQETLPFKMVEPKPEERFRTCVPVYSLKAAAGGFSESQSPEPEGWAEISVGRRLTEDMFVAQVVGKSMEPKIPDGSWCLFTRRVEGSRDGRIVLVEHRDIADPDTEGSYTVKQYRRAPRDLASGEERVGVVLLQPLNKDFEPIVITGGEEVSVRAEFLEVLQTPERTPQ